MYIYNSDWMVSVADLIQQACKLSYYKDDSSISNFFVLVLFSAFMIE